MCFFHTIIADSSLCLLITALFEFRNTLHNKLCPQNAHVLFSLLPGLRPLPQNLASAPLRWHSDVIYREQVYPGQHLSSISSDTFLSDSVFFFFSLSRGWCCQSVLRRRKRWERRKIKGDVLSFHTYIREVSERLQAVSVLFEGAMRWSSVHISVSPK